MVFFSDGPVVGPLRLFLVPFLPITRDKVWWYPETWFDDVVDCCVAIPPYDLSQVFALANMPGNLSAPVLTVKDCILPGAFCFIPYLFKLDLRRSEGTQSILSLSITLGKPGAE